jgi:hypothetical protein
MSRHLRAAMALAMLAMAGTLAPAMAGERATLRVTARVVDRCTFEVPSHIPPWLWRQGEREPWRFLRHKCHGRPPFWVHAKKILLERVFERLRDRLEDRFPDRLLARWQGDDARVREVRHPTRRDVVLITITY